MMMTMIMVRYFTPWVRRELEDHNLPKVLRDVTGQETVPIGIGVVSAIDVSRF